MSPINDLASAAATVAPPAIVQSPTAPRARTFYLVDEAERSTPKPVAAEGRTMISVNGRWVGLRGRTASHAQLLRIAYPDREGQLPGSASVSYRRRGAEGLAGLLTPGDVVPLADGLLVNVNATYAS
ncbi:hypothetical protein [Sphingomonas sp. BAUL-RG-20F-R05-02]|uniref:hypothetical protein n=1 Tax=Sphingomonas sp. BAUL-RG-20F-R05-02 TaxID=2914830 RepID=UPI001F5ADFA8|nr:hypothetical protein [Sphingomonas sp. BAUL-RG-20F-R05-02]